MKCKSLLPKISLVFLLVLLFSCKQESQLEWPEINSQNKPWTRWWWMGNAVDKPGIAYELEEFSKAGLGGVEITPIYGVKGYEENFIEYLSPEWIDRFMYTLKKAGRLGMEVDMATGTGWPFGGPWITSEEACKYMAYKTYEISGGQRLSESVKYIQSPINRTIGEKVKLSDLKRPVSSNDHLQQIAFEQIRFKEELPLVVLMAYSEKGKSVDLTNQVDEKGLLDWTAPEGNWKLYAVFWGLHGKLVERAAPGGEGDIIDHFSEEALLHYLSKFDEAFEGKDISSLRGFFNDSYEVDDAIGEADFTPELFNEFEQRRGYDLREHLPALFGQDILDKKHIRVLTDYRVTISEILRENFTIPWNNWADEKGALVRNQAHGSPANILDLYASVDIPETEGIDLLRIKFASSAGNITGKSLISCEAATWLNEHFRATLAEAKTNVDRFFLGGVNHIVYHGTTYSPREETWPGWMFYASVHFAPSNSFWNDFPALNHYVARCQSLLQEAKPDNDILLYFPFYDRISVPGSSLLEHFSGGGPRNRQTRFRTLADELIRSGYAIDYISDALIGTIQVEGSELLTEGGSYKTILIPSCNYIPLKTFEKLTELAVQGATILFHEHFPEDITGYKRYKEKKITYDQIISSLDFAESNGSDLGKAILGKGFFLTSADVKKLLDEAGVQREVMVDSGLQYIRKKNPDGRTYFITNQSNTRFDGFIEPATRAESAAIFNPNTDQIGLAKVKGNESGVRAVYLQLEPGESCFLRTYELRITGNKYPYFEKAKASIPIEGEWQLSFTKGGPDLPETQPLIRPIPWTDFEDPECKSFSGTAKYSINFDKPKDNSGPWLLNLGDVNESATLILNGKKIATLFSFPYQTIISGDQLKEKDNLLEIDVSNLMANRIIYMEQNGLEYRNFYNVNFPARKAENRGKDGLFTSLNWEPFPSGLQGPVTLTPVKQID